MSEQKVCEPIIKHARSDENRTAKIFPTALRGNAEARMPVCCLEDLKKMSWKKLFAHPEKQA